MGEQQRLVADALGGRRELAIQLGEVGQQGLQLGFDPCSMLRQAIAQGSGHGPRLFGGQLGIEPRGEGIALVGMLALGSVTVNRTLLQRYPALLE